MAARVLQLTERKALSITPHTHREKTSTHELLQCLSPLLPNTAAGLLASSGERARCVANKKGQANARPLYLDWKDEQEASSSLRSHRCHPYGWLARLSFFKKDNSVFACWTAVQRASWTRSFTGEQKTKKTVSRATTVRSVSLLISCCIRKKKRGPTRRNASELAAICRIVRHPLSCGKKGEREKALTC